jgi:hypothetical protein
MINGRSAVRALSRNSRASANPDLLGSIQSINTASGSSSRSAVSASSALAAVKASMPACSSV